MTAERETRLRKLELLRGAGVDPYPGGEVSFWPISSALKRFAEAGSGPPRASVAGRVVALRDFGKAAFLSIQDRTGRIQIYVKREVSGEDTFRLYGLLDIGDIVRAEGELFRTRTGEITIQVGPGGLKLLTKSLSPLPEKWHGLKDPEIRYRRRYLDLIAAPRTLETFLRRARAVTLLRRFLDERAYVEVETPVLHAIPGGAAARPFVTHHNALDRHLYLRIALEIPLKKLLVGGMEKVYEIGRVFRNEGIDTRHNPEFTLLELYHAYGDLSSMMELVESLTAHLARELTGSTKLPRGSSTLDVTPPWPRYDYYDLLGKHSGVDPADTGALRARLGERGKKVDGRSDLEIVDDAFGEFVEPNLQDAAFVTGQPVALTPLCRERADRPGRADRFEAYAAGMEIANAYNELNDPVIQRRRLLDQAGGDEMAQAGRIDEDFLAALEHGMPPAGGLGIGVDRLVMILTDQPSIREVILFPLLKEEPDGAEAHDRV